jgi:hypothetical protein
VEGAIYDLLITGQATAKANGRDVIAPWDLPVTRGLQECVHAFERLEDGIELRPVLDTLAVRPPLDMALGEEAGSPAQDGEAGSVPWRGRPALRRPVPRDAGCARR